MGFFARPHSAHVRSAGGTSSRWTSCLTPRVFQPGPRPRVFVVAGSGPVCSASSISRSSCASAWASASGSISASAVAWPASASNALGICFDGGPTSNSLLQDLQEQEAQEPHTEDRTPETEDPIPPFPQEKVTPIEACEAGSRSHERRQSDGRRTAEHQERETHGGRTVNLERATVRLPDAPVDRPESTPCS